MSSPQSPLPGAPLRVLILLLGCASEQERADRVWTETFGAVVATYAARPLTGPVELDPKLVRGRKVLADVTPPTLGGTREPYEAATVDEVGLVVVDHTISDPAPSVTYEGGGQGYGGEVTEAAFAHPEGKLVYLKTWRCKPDSVTLGVTVVGGGMGAQSFDTHCGGFREGRLRIGGQLVGAVQQLGEELDEEGAKAYRDFVDAASAHLSEAVTPTPPDLAGRRVLHLSRVGDRPWIVAQEERFLPAGRTAMNVPDVGLVAFETTLWEDTPSYTYGSGVVGYAGTTEFVAVAMPEGVVVARDTPPCVLAPEELGEALARMTHETHCLTEDKVMKAWLTGLVGQDAAATP